MLSQRVHINSGDGLGRRDRVAGFGSCSEFAQPQSVFVSQRCVSSREHGQAGACNMAISVPLKLDGRLHAAH